jgi:hypothetical protein
MSAESPLRLLLRLEGRRLSDAFRHPRPAAWLGILLPAALAVGGLWAAGDSVRPDLGDSAGVILLGLIVSTPITLQAYPILFRPSDDAFLRRLGISPRAQFGVRAMRLAVLALVAVVAVLIPFITTGKPLGMPVVIASAAAAASWAASLVAQARAALRIATGARRSLASQSMRAFDPELAAAGALVFAPLAPVAAGAAAAAFAIAPVLGMAPRLAIVAVACAACVPLAVRTFARALPRFAPHAGELAYAPPPDATGGELVVGRGIVSLLPRGAQAVRARDAVIVGRRYRWASRTAWPAAIVAGLVVLRAGAHPQVRVWVTLACGALLAAQGAAVVALGRGERGRTRWMDRALGLTAADRLAGRWATSFGLAMAVALPMAISWWIAVEQGGGWTWMAAAAGVALVASTASLAAAGR